MRASSIRSIRRSELSRAAFEAVVRFGLRGTTLEKVGEIAGVSKGVVLHHFKDKSSLLEAVFRRANSSMSEGLVELYRYAETPYERLWAIVVANFFETIFTRSVCQAWVSLAAEVPHNRQCQRIQTVLHGRMRSNLRYVLKHFLNPDDTERVAFHLSALIDGLWFRGGLQPVPLASKTAIDELEFAITKLLPNGEDSIAKHKEARQKIENIAGILLSSKAFQNNSLPS